MRKNIFWSETFLILKSSIEKKFNNGSSFMKYQAIQLNVDFS